MSYENTECPCGGKKERDTLICKDCDKHIWETTDRFELDHWHDETYTVEARRCMAVKLLSMARRRNKRLALQFAD